MTAITIATARPLLRPSSLGQSLLFLALMLAIGCGDGGTAASGSDAGGESNNGEGGADTSVDAGRGLTDGSTGSSDASWDALGQPDSSEDAGAEVSGRDSGGNTEDGGPEGDRGVDRADAPTTATVHPPIYITINAHGHNYGFSEQNYREYVAAGDLDGWYAQKAHRYGVQQTEILWLAEATERVGARMSYQLNGEYARDALYLHGDGDGGDTAHLRDLVARGHTMSAHFHPFRFSGENEYWENIGRLDMTTALMDDIWSSHMDAIELAVGSPVLRADPAHDRDTPALLAHFNQLLLDYDLSVENVGEDFTRTHWGHRPLTVFRRDLDTALSEDLSGPILSVHSYPQVGTDAPQGLHVAITTVPQLKRRFMDIYAQWLYSQKTGQTPRIWTFGIMTHPDSNSRYHDEMTEMLDWLSGWTQTDSPWGGPVAEFTTDYGLGETFEAWEAEYPGASSFSFDLESYEDGVDVAYPYDLEGMVLATRDAEFVSLMNQFSDQGVSGVELVYRDVHRSEPAANGAVVTTVGDLGSPIYVLWSDAEDVTIDFAGVESGALYAADGVSGEVSEVSASTVTVGEVPVVVTSVREYLEQ